MSNIIILDTGDNYIIAPKTNCLQLVVDLYSLIDISINVLETDYKYNADIMQFIYDNIGRIISYGFSDTDGSTRLDIPTKLVQDIGTAVEFFKIKRFWNGISQYQETIETRNNINMIPNDQTQTYSMFDEQSMIISPLLNTPGHYIIYNKIYNIALVQFLPDKQCLSAHNEFIIIKMIDVQHIDAVKQHFHKISFETEIHVHDKLSAFNNLYNISSQPTKSEKDRIKYFLDTHFTISDDPVHRMKANDLYKEIINHMCTPYEQTAIFKKRVSGFLSEFNLKKKRYTDAYYYYGIQRKEYPAIDLKEIENQRDTERKAWFYKDPLTVTDLLPKSSRSLFVPINQSNPTLQCDNRQS